MVEYIATTICMEVFIYKVKNSEENSAKIFIKFSI